MSVSSCPNMSHPDWKKLMDYFGGPTAMAIYKRNGEKIPDLSEYKNQQEIANDFLPEAKSMSQERFETFQRQKEALSSSLNANVMLDASIGGAGELITGTDTPTIRVNPNYFGGDTLIHEYGHLYIDLLGGMDNPMIKQGRRYLNGTELESEVQEGYPELAGEKLDKEILATAVGREGEDIWKARNGTMYQRFKNWLDLFYNRLKKALGLQYNVAKDLANQMLSNQVVDNLREDLANERYQQKTELTSKADAIRNKTDLISKIKNSLSTKLGRYLRILNSSRTTESQKEAIENLRKLMNEFGKKSDEHSLFSYVDTGLRETSAMLNRMKGFQNGDIQVTASRLKNIHDYLQSYSHAEELRNLLENDADLDGKFRENTLSEESKKTMLDALDEVITNHSKIQYLYRQQSKSFLASKFAQRDGRIHEKYREGYRNEFDKSNKRSRPLIGSKKYYVNGKEVSQKEYKSARSEYVNEQMSDNNDEIVAKERQHWMDLFTLGPSDLGFGESYIMDPSNINNDLIQIAHEMLERADFRAMQDSISKFKEADRLFVKYKQEHTEGNQRKKYDALIEDEVDENGKKTGKKARYLVGKYYSKVYEIDTKFYNDIQKAKEEGNEEEVKRLEKEHEQWMDENTKKVAGKWYPIDKWKNPQFAEMQEHRDNETITGQMYDHILKLREETDMKYPNITKLNKSRWGTRFYELPAINASNMERLMDNGFIETIKQNITDKFKIRSDETDWRPEDVEEEGSDAQKTAQEMKRVTKAMADESGKLHQTIPVHFRGEIDPNDQSFDLLSIHLLDNAMAANYKEKAMIHAELEMMKDISANRKVQKTQNVFTKGWHKMVNLFTGEDEGPITEDGENTQAHKALESLIESRLYGIKKKGNKTMNKIIDNMSGWTGDVMLIGNYLAASANLMQGKTMNWIESIGGTVFDHKDLVAAEKKYWSDFPSFSKDFGKRRFFSKTNLLIEKFNALGDWHPVARRFVEDTKLKQKMKKSTLHGLTNIAEHYIQSSVMYAVLNNIKVKDKNGNYLGRNDEGKIIKVDSVDDAMSIDEAYDVVDGELVLNDRVASTTNTIDDSEDFNREQVEDISFLIRDINADLQGQYDGRQQSIAARTWWGRSFMLLRRWIPRGWMRRFRGFSTIGLDSDETRLDEEFYSRSRRGFKSGMYSDTFRLLMNKEYLNKLKEGGVKASYNLLKSNWNELSDQEYANVRMTVGEFAVAVGTVTAAALVKGLASDADDEYSKQSLFYLAFLQRRLYSEMIFYLNPQETLRIMRSPAASLSLVENSLQLIGQLEKDFPYVNGMETYQRGRRKGQWKIRKDVEDMVPLFNQLNRNVEESLNWLYRNQLIN